MAGLVNRPRILALDVSKTATGWAFGEAGEAPISGVKKFGNKTSTPDDVWAEAFRWISETIDLHQANVVYIEAPLQRMAADEDGHMLTSVETLGLLWSLQAVMRVCIRLKLASAAHLVVVQTARKSFTGRGTYPKGEAKRAIIKHAIACGWLTEENANDARADACCVFAHASLIHDRDTILMLRPNQLGSAKIARPPLTNMAF